MTAHCDRCENKANMPLYNVVDYNDPDRKRQRLCSSCWPGMRAAWWNENNALYRGLEGQPVQQAPKTRPALRGRYGGEI